MDLSRSTVAVTGATGFMGRYLVRALLARGARVVAVVRNPDRVPALAAAGVELRRADLADRAALAAGFAGVDAVLSNAGLISIGQHDHATVIRSNVEGTANALNAAADAGVRRVIMTSSAVVYRPRFDQTYTEDHPLREAGDLTHRFNVYAVSKALAEREAWRIAGARGLALSTFRPQAIYGAFDDHGATAWLKRLNQGPVGLWLAGMRYPSVYAGDLAEATCRMLERPVAEGRAYNLTAPPDLRTFWDLLREWREAGGRAPRLVLPLPAPTVRRYAIDRAQADLDFVNRDLVDGMREVLALEAAGGL
jgi:nucleoside-diphosphate-sugar epimerase